MSGLSLFTPIALALSALAIPIVLLYMLRLRRTETAISSTFLWRQLIRDREANAPWQRLRFSWLLLLQLLILLALVLAMARPFSKVKTITTGRIVLLLDASASMRATDVNPSRFAEAQDIALEMVDSLGSDDTMTVIKVSDVPEVLAAASRDHVVLRDAIRDARAEEVTADWVSAMTLAAAGAVGVDELNVVIISDGGLPANLPQVPGDVRFVPVGDSGDNVAISALATSALPGQPPQLFARLNNYGETDADVILDIRLNGSEDFFWARRYTVPARNYVDIFEVDLPEDYDTLIARLTLPGRSSYSDYLAADNVAYAVRDRAGAGRVLLVTEDNIFLRQIFLNLPGVELYEMLPTDPLPEEKFDLYVFDGMLPDQLPDGDLLYVNPSGNTDFFQVGEQLIPVGSIETNRDDARARNLAAYMNSVNLRSYRGLLGNLEWGTILASIDNNPLIVAGEVGSRQVAVLAFDARYPNTDMVVQPAWPILMAELAAWYAPPRITDVTASIPPGAPVSIQLIENATEAVVVHPDGDRIEVDREGSRAIFAGTTEPGLYRVDLRRDDRTVKSGWFAVNLFDATESDITPERSVTVGESTHSGDARKETGRHEWWPWVVVVGLLILVVEWIMYHRSLRRMPTISLTGLRRTPLKARVRMLLRQRSTPRRPSSRLRTSRR